jgi:hypothetical protein
MSVMMFVCRIDGAAVEQLLSRQTSAHRYFSECYHKKYLGHDNESDEQAWIDLDKAWFAIHSLLTEGREDTALPAGTLLGGVLTPADEPGDGAWHVLTVEQTADFAAHLATKADDMVEQSPRYAALFSGNWNDAQMKHYVGRHFRNLKRLVTLAAAKGNGLMTLTGP